MNLLLRGFDLLPPEAMYGPIERCRCVYQTDTQPVHTVIVTMPCSKLGPPNTPQTFAVPRAAAYRALSQAGVH